MNKELAINLLRGSVLGTNEELHEAVLMAIKALKDEPKQGHWIVNNETEEWDTIWCDQCHDGMWNKKGDSYPNYCFSCGARMNGVKESEEVKETKIEKIISASWFAKEMRRIERNNDTETAHIFADKLMCEVLCGLGYGEGVDVFEKMDKWYS